MTDSKIDISGGDNTIINNQPGAAVIIGNISDSQAQQVLVPFANVLITAKDAALLEIFRDDYGKLLEKCIALDYSSQPIPTELHDEIYFMFDEKWSSLRMEFSHPKLKKLKYAIINALEDLRGILEKTGQNENDYFHVIDGGRLCFNNWICDEIREVTIPLRYKLRDLYWDLFEVKPED